MLNLSRSSYLSWIAYTMFFLGIISMAGCENKPGSSGLGSVAGVAQLSEPDGTTGHAGILVFFAGTPYQARTDQQGRYRIDGVAAGTYDLVAEKTGYQGQVIQGLTINPVVHTVDAPLQPRATMLAKAEPASSVSAAPAYGTITGTVFLSGVDQNDNGGTRVEVNGTAFVTVSSNQGQYRLLNVEPGTYALSFHKEGYRPFTSEDIVVSTGTTEMKPVALEVVQNGDIVSPASAAAAAAVIAAAQTPVGPPPGPDEKRNITGVVELKDAEGLLLQEYTNVTVAINGTDTVAEINEQGQFRFDNLTSGSYVVIGTVEGGNLVQIPVDLETQRSAAITVKLGPEAVAEAVGGSVKGKVVLLDPEDEALPDASGVQVAINGTQFLATTSADGLFTIAGVPPGNYTMTATRDTFESANVQNVAVNAAAPVDVGEVRLAMKVDRPRVVSTNPANNAKEVTVGMDLPISVKFSAKMAPETVRSAITLTPSTPFTAAIGKGSGTGADDDTLVITLSNDDPKAPIQFGALYRVTIAATAANFDGITMAEPYSFSFRSSNPGVISTYPAQGATRAYVDQVENAVLINFNTKLDPDSINDRNIRVKPDGGLSVSTTYTNSDSTGWTTVRVSTNWQADTAYTVTVSRRVKASNGQSLGNTPYTLRFRTQPLEIITMPIIETR